MAYTTPPLWIAGATLTAAQLNAYIRDNWRAIGDAWGSYTPALTNWTVGNGTIVGARALVGATCFWRVAFTLGSTTGTTGTLSLSLPATANHPVAAPLGVATLIDTSAGNSRNASVRRASTATTATIAFDGSPTAISVRDNQPWTWANTDVIFIDGCFEAIP